MFERRSNGALTDLNLLDILPVNLAAFMQSYFLLIIFCPLFAGCFTISAINKAKLDKKPETADSVLTSYKENDGNITIIYSKPSNRHIYKISQPIDSIIIAYRNSHTLDLVNPNAGSVFKGVFFTENVNQQRGYQRVILFEKETPLTDTTGLAQAIGYNRNLAKPLHEKFYIPIGQIDTSDTAQRERRKSVSFVLNMDLRDSAAARKEMYLIVLQPQRRKYTRYLLLPATVALDAITLPFQVIGFGILWLLDKKKIPLY
jgi:hypothetical protein